MRWSPLVCAIIMAGGFAVSASAQSTLDFPAGSRQAYLVDSGAQVNPTGAAASVFQHIVRIENSAWIRLYFNSVRLSPGSYLRLTSRRDGETQILDQNALRMWSDSSAYFNGDSVRIELIAAPNTSGDRFTITGVDAAGMVNPAGGGGACGICGPDDRVPSSQNWSCRLLPAGCTASVYNASSCLLTAGQCVEGTMVVEFNVPISNGDCSINHPPVADQFPILSETSENGGVGNDWAVLVPGTNNLGETPFERYGDLRPIGDPVPAGVPIALWSFGVDFTCSLSQTQQTSSGSMNSVANNWLDFNTDLRNGSSGAGMISGGEIVGIATHCAIGCSQFGTRIDLPGLVEAIKACEGGGLPACNPNAGDCCESNGTPGCNDQACCRLVCVCDPFCCDFQWDSVCAGDGACGAQTLCAVCDGGDPTEACCFDDGTCLDLTVAACAAQGGTSQGSGTDCATTKCPQPEVCGDPNAGDCCTANDTPGCNDKACCISVCDVDPLCCDSEWDQACAHLAEADPNCSCGAGGPCGIPGAGDCCFESGSPGCDDADCCNSVCDVNPFCCDVEWDQTCVDVAAIDPDCPCGAGDSCGEPSAGDCCEGNGSPGCNDAVCCYSVCEIDPFCCDISWDGPCADAAEKDINCNCGAVPAEACCFSDGSCEDFTPASCAAQDGDAQGPGSSCATTRCGPPCQWDLDGDGLVNAADLAILLGAWSNPYDPTDLANLLGNWGPC